MDRKPGLQQRAKVKGVSNADPLLEQLYEEHRRQFPEKKREALDNAHAWAACKLTAVTQRIQELPALHLPGFRSEGRATCFLHGERGSGKTSSILKISPTARRKSGIFLRSKKVPQAKILTFFPL